MADFDWLKKYKLGIFIVGAAALVDALVWTFEGYEYLDKGTDLLIRWGTVVDPKTNLAGVRPWFEAVLIVSALALAGLIALVVNLWRRKPVEPVDAAAKYKLLQDEHDKLVASHRKAQEMTTGMMAATSRIRNQFSPVGKLVKSFDYARVTYYIYKDFTAYVVREYGIRSNKEPVHFWTAGNHPTPYADPADYLNDIAFEIKDEKGAKLPYLPIKNDAFNKDVVIYFLPRIEPGDPARHVKIKFTWPKYLRQIAELGSENFSLTLDSIDPVPTVEFAWLLEPGTGRNLTGEVISTRLPNDDLNQAASAAFNGATWSGFSYKVTNGPAGTFKYELRAALQQP